MEKLIPALVFKNENDCSFDLDIFSFDREVQVRNLFVTTKDCPLKKLIYEQQTNKDEKPKSKKFISSIDMKPKFQVKHVSEQIKITDQPYRRILYTSSVEIHRSHKPENLPCIKIIPSNTYELTWKTSVKFDMYDKTNGCA